MWRLRRGTRTDRAAADGSARADRPDASAPAEASATAQGPGDEAPAAAAAAAAAAVPAGSAPPSAAADVPAATAPAPGEPAAHSGAIDFSVAATDGGAAPDEAPLQDESRLPRRKLDDRPLGRADRVGAALDRWTQQIAGTAERPSFLTRMRSDAEHLDLTHSHPSGLAQLLAGRGPTRLSSLVREVGALAEARAQARTIREVAERQADEVGLTTCHLAIGEASWIPEGGGEPYQAPVLIRPITLRLRGNAREDVDLDLDASVDVNPVLLRALRDAGIAVDARALLATTQGPYGFDPTPVLDAFKALGQPLPGFRISQALVVGNLMDAAGHLVEDLRADREEWASSELVAALAGDPEARAAVRPSAPVEEAPLPPETGMVTALSPDRAEALAAILRGDHLALTTPPGTDPIDLVVDLAQELIGRGRTVLVLSQRSGHLAELAERAGERGLEDLLFDLSPDPALQRNASAALLHSMRRAGSFSSPVTTEEPVELARTRDILAGHVEAMHSVQLPWEASAHDAISALAALTRMRPSPRTEVRLRPQVAASMIGPARVRYAESLREAARIGALRVGPEETAWFGAAISSDTQASRALELVGQLRETLLPALSRAMERTGGDIGLKPAQTLAQFGARLALLDDVAAILTQMQPAVLTTELDDMIRATGATAASMKWSERRTLRKQAQDLVRPGLTGVDVHDALRRAHAIAERWSAQAAATRRAPSVPPTLESHRALAARLQGACDELAVLLDGTPAGGDLSSAPIDELTARVDALHRDRGDLAEVPRRTVLLRSLAFDGLGDLVEDLRSRRVEEKDVAAELDLAWWQTVLELIARAEPTISQYDGTSLSQVAERFRRLDGEHLERASFRVRGACDDRLVERMKAFPDTSRAAITELARSSTISVRDLAAKYEDILFAVRPAWLASPYLVPQVVPRGEHFDVVIIADGGRLPTAAALPALARARQAVVIGDPLAYADLPGSSVLDDMLAIAGHVPLRRDPRPTGSIVRAFAQRRSLAGPVLGVPNPAPPESDRLIVVENSFGPVTPGLDFVESTELELRRVTDLVIEHARSRPERSLAVLTLTPAHARKVLERIMHTIAVVPSLREFFDAQAEEYFTVVPAAHAASVVRDDVIVSLGFGRTPHGRMLHRFGPLSADGGRKALATVLTRARGRTTVVAAFDVEDLDPSRLRTEGARDLRALLVVLRGGADDDVVVRDPAAALAQELADVGAAPADADADAEAEGDARGAETASPEDAPDAHMQTAALPAEGAETISIDAAIEAALAADAEDDGEASDDASDADDADEVEPAEEGVEVDSGAEDTESSESVEADAAEPSAEAVETAPESEPSALAADGPDEDAEPSEPAEEDTPSEGEDSAESSAPEEGAADSEEEPASGTTGEWRLETNALVHDLADRLWRRGLVVETDFGDGAERIELALGHPELPGRALLAVDTDGERYVATDSQRERDRLRAERLESFGWATERVWSWALFIDPEGEAERIQRAVDRALMLYRSELEEDALDGATGTRHRLPRPQIPAGHQLSFYSSEDFDAVVEYLVSDGRARMEDQLATEVRSFLGFTQRSVLLDVSVSSAIRRYQERQ